MDISVLMSVYAKEKPEYFTEAVNSIINQTIAPKEIILVRDGLVPKQLQNAIDSFMDESKIEVKYIPLDENGGLGNALNIGVKAASNELIARMDTDDISVPDRFEMQLAEFMRRPELDVIGGQVTEFETSVSEPVGKRNVPRSNDEIAIYLKKRNPLNHPTVMFKKTAVINAGNYADRHYVEDYDLWCRMQINGCRFENLSETLVYMRVTPDTYARRGGMKYFRSLKKLEQDKLDMKIISKGIYLENVAIRFAQCVLSCGSFRRVVYQRMLREQE